MMVLNRRGAAISFVTLAAGGALVLLAPRVGEAAAALIVVAVCVIASSLPFFPPWSITLLLWIIAPLMLWRFDPAYSPWNVARGSAHSVLIVFLAGFAFAVAARRHGIDEKLTRGALRFARGNHIRLIALLAAATLWLSAWISNVAAAALMFGAVRPLLRKHVINYGQQRTAILAIAIAANLGGLATPIGTGANAIAVAAIRTETRVTFLEWIIFAVPFAVLSITIIVGLAVLILKPPPLHPIMPRGQPAIGKFDIRTAIIFGGTVVMWLAEPVHHVETHVVAAIATALLLVTRAIGWRELKRMDWGSLLLIAGGIGIGYVMQTSGAAQTLVDLLPISADRPRLALFFLCLLSAFLASVMSNTGTAALLIPVAMTLIPAPSTAILIALATGLGFPFAISTPANAMAVHYGARQRDLMLASLPAIVAGSALLALTGPAILRALGVL
jgi:sodium-dependent dicarboxylate transporter 2/3/5